MTMRAFAWAAILSGAVVVQAHAQTPAKPDPKPETKPEAVKAGSAASIAGKWNVNIDNPQGAMQVALELKKRSQGRQEDYGHDLEPDG
jgi:hypothetical protein